MSCGGNIMKTRSANTISMVSTVRCSIDTGLRAIEVDIGDECKRGKSSTIAVRM